MSTEVSCRCSPTYIFVRGSRADHPGFGVHISFVRSITMDKWSEDQLKKMKVSSCALHFAKAHTKQLGGNERFKEFIENYGSEGGYSKGIGMVEKYNSWAAAQYRDKVSPPTTLPCLYFKHLSAL